MSKRKLIEDITVNPARFYRSPVDVMRDRRFGDAERIAILEAWQRAVTGSPDGDRAMADALTQACREARERLKQVETAQSGTSPTQESAR